VIPLRGHTEFPADAPLIPIQIQVWHESKPFSLGPVFETRGARTGGTLHLEDHFVEYLDDQNSLIEIRVGGEEVSRKKVKYSGEVGVEYDHTWVRATRLMLPDAG
jgi:hypothetical protein